MYSILSCFPISNILFFLSPDNLHINVPGLIKVSKQKLPPVVNEILLKDTFRQFTRPKPVRKAITQAKSISKPITKTISTPGDLPSLDDLPGSPDEFNPLDHASSIYKLTFSSWPVRAGIKILIGLILQHPPPSIYQFAGKFRSFPITS